ncbi:hypothetical protein BS78_05G197300 [Paspalum vaginatum]|nr:hypothetical protein BS78_05G197300 [Paspalum vaginatum]
MNSIDVETIAFTNEADGSMINSLQMKLLLSIYIEQMSST